MILLLNRIVKKRKTEEFKKKERKKVRKKVGSKNYKTGLRTEER